MNTRRFRTTALAATLALGLTTAHAQTDIQWDFTGPTDRWSNPANWQTNNVPDTPTENVVINSNFGNQTIRVDADFTVGSYNNQDPGTGLSLDSSVSLTFAGTDILNGGFINLLNNSASLLIDNDITHNGAGLGQSNTINLSGDGNNRIASSLANAPTFTHTINDLRFPFTPLTSLNNGIFGFGKLGDNTLKIVNGGFIGADQPGSTLIVDPANDPNATGEFTNTGHLTAYNGGTVLLDGNGGGSFSNTAFFPGGFFAFDNSQITHTNNAVLEQSTTSTLTAGSYTAFNGTLDLPGTAAGITTLGNPANPGENPNPPISPRLELAGPDAQIRFGGVGIQNSLTTIYGNLVVSEGHVFDAVNPVTNHGFIDLFQGTIITDRFEQTASGLLFASGTLRADAYLSGRIAPLALDTSFRIEGNLTLDPEAQLIWVLRDPDGLQNSGRVDITPGPNNLDGDLVLDGTLSISSREGFGEGAYDLFTFTGDLTDNGLDIINLPDGFTASTLTQFNPNGGGTVRLVVIPEPTTATLLALTTLPLLTRRRRNH